MCLLLASSAHSVELPGGGYLNGFAQQTSMWSDNNQFVSDTDDQVALDIVDIGLTLNYPLFGKTSFSGQLNSHQAGETSNGEVKVDYAYVQWQAIKSTQQEMNLQAGTIVLRYGFYNDLRDVALSRPNIFTPYSIYYDRFRQSVFAHDGVAYNHKVQIGFDNLRFDAAFAVPRSSEEEAEEVVPENQFRNGNTNGQEAYSARLVYDTPLVSRYALSAIYLRWDFDAEMATGLAAMPYIPVKGGFIISSRGVSLERYFDQTVIRSEYFRHRISYDNLIAGQDLSVDINAAYVQVVTPCWLLQCLVQSEWFETVPNSISDRNSTRDTAIGINWKALHHFGIRLEAHKVYGLSWLRETSDATHNNWHYLALQLAWTF